MEIQAKNPADLKKQVQKFRDNVDVILVHGGDLKINRAATEDPRIDILNHPYRSRYDGGINHVLAVKAAENKVSMEINLKYFLVTLQLSDIVLSLVQTNSEVTSQIQFPIVITK